MKTSMRWERSRLSKLLSAILIAPLFVVAQAAPAQATLGTTPSSGAIIGGAVSNTATSMSYLQYPANSRWAVSTSADYTIAWWQYGTNLSSYPRIFGCGSSASTAVSEEGGTFYFWKPGYTGTYFSQTSSYTNTWLHYAIVRQSGKISIYENGVARISNYADTSAVCDSSNPFYIGTNLSYSTDQTQVTFHGYIQGFEFINGTAKYTAAFTPPSSYSDYTTSITTNTKLLLYPTAATDISGNTADKSGNAVTFTNVGSVGFYANLNTATFNNNGGSLAAPTALTQASIGGSVTLPTYSGTKTGFTFGGWNTAADGSGSHYDVSTSYAPPSNITLYAQWYSTITFNANNSTSTAASWTSGATPPYMTIANTTATNSLPNGNGLTNTAANGNGYTFGGWNTNTSGTGTTYAGSNNDLQGVPSPSVWLRGGNFNTTTGTWTASYGTNVSDKNGASNTHVSNATESASNGSTATFSYTKGDTASGINLGNFYEGNFTLCAVVRMTSIAGQSLGTTNTGVGRIFQASTINWLSGYWGGYMNSYYHEGWQSVKTANQTTIYGTAADTNWHMTCDRPTSSRFDGLQSYSGSGYSANNNLVALNINSGGYAAEASNWALADVMLFPSTTLSDAQVLKIEKYYASNFGLTTASTNVLPAATSQVANYQSTGSTTLYAKWNSVVSFNGNNNTGGTAPASLSTVSTVTLPATTTLTKTGYVFDGWYTNMDGVNGTWYAPGSTYTPIGNTTLYPFWALALSVSGTTPVNIVTNSSGRTDTHTVSNGVVGVAAAPVSIAFTSSNSGITIDTSTANAFAFKVGNTVQPGTYYETVTVTDAGGVSTTQYTTINVVQALRWSTTNTKVINTTFGKPASVTLTITGGASARSFSVSSMPRGMTLTTTSGGTGPTDGTVVLATDIGTPVGTYIETVTATDALGAFVSQAITVTVNAVPIIGYSTATDAVTPYVSTGLVLNVDFTDPNSYSGSGNTATDTSSSARSFTFYNTTPAAAAPTFTATNGGYITLNGSTNATYAQTTSLPSMNVFSVESWFNPAAGGSSSSSPGIVSDMYTTAGDKINFFLGWCYSATQICGEYFNGSAWVGIAAYTPTLNVWQHVIYTVTNDGAGTYTGTLYLNGGATVVASSTSTSVPASSNRGLRIGRRWDGADYFVGKIGSVRIYNTPLTAEQVKVNFRNSQAKYLGTSISTTNSAYSGTLSLATTQGKNLTSSIFTETLGTGTPTFSLTGSNSGKLSLSTTGNTTYLNVIGSAVNSTNSTTAATLTDTLYAADTAGAVTAYSLSVTVNPVISLTSSTSNLLVTGGSTASATVSASYGTGLKAFAMSLSPASSAITMAYTNNIATISVGSTAAAGTYTATVTATDSATATATSTITIVVASPITIAGSGGSSITTTYKKAATLGLTVLNGTGTRTVAITTSTSCPVSTAGFTLTATSLVSGTSATTFSVPTTTPIGTYQCVVTATDANSVAASTTITITVNQWPVMGSGLAVGSGLVYDFDSGNSASYGGSGSTWTNLAGASGTNATFVSTPTYSSDFQGNLNFNGNSNYGSFANPGVMTAFTVSVWAKITAMPSAGLGTLITEQYPSGGSSINYSIYLTSTSVCAGRFNGTSWIYPYTGTAAGCYAVSTGTWYNFVYTMTKTNNVYTSDFYINATAKGSTYTDSAPTSSGNPIYIGRRWDAAEYFNGSMPVVSIYNRGLTASEVSQNYSSLASRFASPVASVTMTQGVAASLSGSSNLGSGNHTYTTAAATGVSVTGGSGNTFTLNLDSNVLATNSTTPRTFTQAVTATDSTTAATTLSYSITVNPPVLLSLGSTSPTGTAGVALVDTVTATQGTGTKTFAISPAINGISISSTGTNTASISTATTLSAGTYVETVTATDSLGATATQAITITVNPPPSIAGPSALAMTTGYDYKSPTFTISGGSGTRTATVTSGLSSTYISVQSLDSTSFYLKVLGTTPATNATTAAVYNVVLTVADGLGASSTYAVAITVNPILTLSGTTIGVTATYGQSQTVVYQTTGGTGPFNVLSSNACAPVSSISGSYTILKFVGIGSCTWTVPNGVTSIDQLVVAGGGSGGTRHGGGGGAGGYVYQTAQTVTPGATKTITVGAGGAATPAQSTGGTQGNVGFDSSFNGVTAKGGGLGGQSPTINGGSGGSNGGAMGGAGNVAASVALAVAGQGNIGGNGTSGSNEYNWSGGGGGGYGGAGANGTLDVNSYASGGNGGAGVSNSITGSAICYAAGGAGSISSLSSGTAGTGGSCSGATGSGGNGSRGTADAVQGTDETGSGGGAGGFLGGTNAKSGKGGNGVVAIRYLTPTATTTNLITLTTDTGYTGSSAKFILNIPESVNVGSSTQTVKITQGDGTAAGVGASTTYNITVTINKATPTVALSLPGNVTSVPYGFGVTLTATTNTAGNVTFTNGATTLCSSVATVSNTATCRWVPSAVTSASLVATLTPTDSSNYNNGSNTALAITVSKADTLTVTAKSETFTYDGAQKGSTSTSAITYTGLSELESISGISLNYGASGSTRPTNAGTYTVTPSAVTGSANLTTSYYRAITYVTGTLTINRATPVLALSYGDTSTAVVSYKASGTYSPIWTNPSDGLITYSSANTSICTVDSSVGSLATIGIGTCDVSASIGQGTNYLAATITRTVTVNRASRVITLTPGVSNLKYGDSTTLTTAVTGSNSEGIISYSLTSTPTCTFDSNSLTVTAISASGSCLITATISQGDHYLAATSSAPTLVFSKASAPVVTFQSISSTTYIANTPAAISPAPTVTGLKFTDAVSSVDAVYSASTPTVYGPATNSPPTLGGTYTVTPANLQLAVGSLSNYDTPTYTAVSFTINKAVQVVLSTTQSMSAANTPFQISLDGGSSTGTISYSVSSGSCTVNSSGVLNATASGLCTVTATKIGDRNYFDVVATFTINVANFVYAPVVVVSSGGGVIGGTVAPAGIVTPAPTSPVPSITALTPSTAYASDWIVVSGARFAGATYVLMGRSSIPGISLNLSNDGNTDTLTFQVPATAAAGNFPISVFVPVIGQSPERPILTIVTP